MADHPSNNEPIEWFLARDGQQHGPLNESEMRAFVDMGHLRPTDLVWRPGFAEWLAAPDVFALAPPAPVRPPAPAPAPAAPPPRAAPEPPPAAAQRQPARPVAAPAAVVAPVSGPVLTSPEQLLAPAPAPAPARPVAAPVTEAPAAVPPRGADPARPRQSIASSNPFGWPTEPQPLPEPRAPHPAGPQPLQSRQPAPFDGEFDDADMEEDAEPRRSFGLGRIAAALALAIIVGAGIAAALRPDKLAGLVPAAVLKSVGAETTARAAPFVAVGGGSESIDEAFQRSAIWRHVKAEFPEWYGERLKEAAKFAAEKRGELAIAKHLAEAMVTLRRKHADQALTASPERLRFVATTFLDNLQAMSKQNVDVCYGFISQGETYPPILDMLQKPDSNQGLQKQLMAVFEAIAEGRKAPQSYLPPRKSDYDTLAAELNARGWSENDLRTFSDPRALGRATPQDVCRMVQDWFAAQIAIKDKDAQLRLLVESLRPVVAG